MVQVRVVSTTSALILFLITSAAIAGSNPSGATDEKSVVQTFYDFLSNPASKEHAEAFKVAAGEGWESIGDYSGENKKRDQFVGQVSGFFAKLMPDLKWEVQEMVQDGNTVVVRGRATGTPNGPLFGVDGKGKSFDILTIDIHTVENGKIVRSYHVEDWAGALRQLAGK